jgi:hypothetical protein
MIGARILGRELGFGVGLRRLRRERIKEERKQERKPCARNNCVEGLFVVL